MIGNDDALYAKHGWARTGLVDSEVLVPFLNEGWKDETFKRIFNEVRGSYTCAALRKDGMVLLLKHSNPLVLYFDQEQDIIWFASEKRHLETMLHTVNVHGFSVYKGHFFTPEDDSVIMIDDTGVCFNSTYKYEAGSAYTGAGGSTGWYGYGGRGEYSDYKYDSYKTTRKEKKKGKKGKKGNRSDLELYRNVYMTQTDIAKLRQMETAREEVQKQSVDVQCPNCSQTTSFNSAMLFNVCSHCGADYDKKDLEAHKTLLDQDLPLVDSVASMVDIKDTASLPTATAQHSFNEGDEHEPS